MPDFELESCLLDSRNLQRSAAIFCSVRVVARLNSKAMTARTSGIISSCSQSQRAFPGWYTSVLTIEPADGPLIVCAVVTWLYPSKPVPLNQTTAKTNAMTTTTTNPITPVATGCCFIFCHQERSL